MARIYLDHNATTPLHPSVLSAILEAAPRFGNPSSLHEEGRAARQLVERARSEVSALLAISPAEIVFTASGTESNSTAILGAARLCAKLRGRRGQIVSSPIEHPSVGAALATLADEGHKITKLKVDGRGRIDVAELQRAVSTEETALVSLAFCNHELGNVYPIAELCRISHQYGALFHCDAVQAVGKMPVDVAALEVDLLSLSAHKLYGPKGSGALFVRSQPRASTLPALHELPSLLRGGGQERGRRAGTENLLGIVGFGAAAVLAGQVLLPQAAEVAALRDRLAERLLRLPGARRHGDTEHCSPSTVNLAFEGVEGELLLMNLDLRGIAVSTGAACSSGSLEPSPVLLALGLKKDRALEAVRFSLGYENTAAEVNAVAAAVEDSVAQVRNAIVPCKR